MKKKLKKKIIMITLMVILVMMAGSFVNIYKASPFNKDIDNINILVFGVDASKKEESNFKRSDSIMLVNIDKANKRSSIISIPRDTYVSIPGRKNKDKINHSHAYGGPELLVETVETLLDIDITYYVRINYKAVIEVVDALGGIEIDVPLDMKYDDPYDTPPLHIDIKKGLQVLDGQQSVEFMRFRKGYANQDLGRIDKQQEFVEAIIDKVMSPSTILKLPKLINIAYSNVDTNIPKNNILSLGPLASSFNKDNLERTTLEGKPKTIKGTSYYVTNEESLLEIKKNLLNK